MIHQCLPLSPPGYSARSRGFTLVELLVVMAIISLIAGIGVYAVAPFQSSAAVTDGGMLVQSWLNAAKARAMRDRAPRGIRLLAGDEITDETGAADPTLVTKCVFVEVHGGPGSSFSNSGDAGTGIYHSNANLKTTLTVLTALAVPIVESDTAYIEINAGTLRLIANGSGTTIKLVRPYPFAIPQGSGAFYRIIRTPNPVNASTASGLTASTQDILRMPKGSTINLNGNSQPKANPAFALNRKEPIDILFAPSGAVMTPAVNSDRIVLWITGTKRDSAGKVNPLQGQPTLIVINTRTGSVSGVPADTAPTSDPYKNVP